MRKLVKANIRKDRNVLAAFLLIIILSSMLLHTGLFVNQYDALYDEKRKDRGICNAEIFAYGDGEVVRSVMDHLSHVTDYSLSDIIRSGKVNLYSTKKDFSESRNDVVVHSVEDAHTAHAVFLKRDDTLAGPRIYLNLYFASANDLVIGDEITLDVENLETETYTVAGIYEDIQQGNPYAWCSLCLDEESFRKQYQLAEKATEEGKDHVNQHEILATFVDGMTEEEGLHDTISALEDAGVMTYGFTIELAKVGYVSITNILAAFMTVFAIIAMAVCFVMIIFTINNNIDRDVRNIGALRAVGHTNGQIRTAMLLEYLVIGAVGAGLGTLLSYILMPVIDKSLLRAVNGMFWENRFYPGISLIVIFSMMAAMALVVFCSTRRLRNLHPATALRFGLQSNSFKKNYLPLATTKGKLNPLLAAKSMLQSMGQNMIILGVVIVVSFMTIFSGILFYNTRVDITRFQQLIDGDVPDGVVMLSSADFEGWQDAKKQVAEVPGISEAYGYSWHNINVQGRETFTFYTDAPECLQCGVYEGQMFREDNEAVIGRLLAEEFDVKIGDEIEVECSGKKARFIVTGFQQSVMNMGQRVFISVDGAKRLGIEPFFSEIRVRVDGASRKSVDRALELASDKLGSTCTGVDNVYRYQRSSENLTMFVAMLLILLLIFVNVAIIYLVIKLLLKTVFIKKEKEFGIKKAVGFTSRQLRLQLAMSLFPVSLLASAGGAVLGFFLVNPLLSMVLGGFGIASANFIICPSLILLTIAAVGILVFGMTYIMSGRMKKVSAYELIQE